MQRLNKILLYFIPAFLFLSTSVSARSKLPDDAENIVIKSDTFHFDNKTGVAIYTGNIKVEQGSRLLTGDKLNIYRDQKTGDIARIVVTGQLAHYQGLTDVNKPLLYAQAQTITYETAKQFLVLSGDAQVTQEGDVYRAAHIEYDVENDIVYSPPTQGQQTIIILKGKENAGI